MIEFDAVDTRTRTTPFYESEIEVTAEVDVKGRARIAEITLVRGKRFKELDASAFNELETYASADDALDAGLRLAVAEAAR